MKSFVIKRQSRGKLMSEPNEGEGSLQKYSFPLEICDFQRNFKNLLFLYQNSKSGLTKFDLVQSNGKYILIYQRKTLLLARKRTNHNLTNILYDQEQLRLKPYYITKQNASLKLGNKIKMYYFLYKSIRHNSVDTINKYMAKGMSHSYVNTRDTFRTQNHNSQKLVKRLVKDVTFSMSKTAHDFYLQKQINKQSLKLSNEIEKKYRVLFLNHSKLVQKRLKKTPIFSPFLDETNKYNQSENENRRIILKRSYNEQHLPSQLVIGFINGHYNEMEKSTIKSTNESRKKTYFMKEYMNNQEIKCCFGTVIGKKYHYHYDLQYV